MDSFLSAMGFGSADEVPPDAPSALTESSKAAQQSGLGLSYKKAKLILAYGAYGKQEVTGEAAAPPSAAADATEQAAPVFKAEPSPAEAPPAEEPIQAAPAPALQPPPVVREVVPEPVASPESPVKPAMGLSVSNDPLAPTVKLESALLTPEPEAPAPAEAPAELLGTPAKSVPEVAVSSAAQAAAGEVGESAVSTAPASPADLSPEKPEVAPSSADSKGAQAAPEQVRPQPRRPAPQSSGGAPWRTLSGSRNNQTSAYQRLGTSEANPSALTAYAAASEPSSEPLSAATLSGSKVLPRPTARHSCGAARLALRTEYNQKEINAALLLREFDANNNGVLEPEEFRSLLNSWIADQGSLRTKAGDEDLEYIMAVADKNHDDRISVDEILSALQAWYSFNYMPFEVNAGLGRKYGISADGSPLPSLEKMQEILMDLNGFQFVELEEAAFVRQLAKSLGATDEKVTFLQMRRAIAIWYINVEREQTDMRRLMEDSMTVLASFAHHHGKRLLKSVPSTKDIKDSVTASAPESVRRYLVNEEEELVDPELGTPLATADPDNVGAAPAAAQEPEHVPIPVMNTSPEQAPFYIPLAFWSVFFLLPGLYMIHVASVYPLKPTCEHDLSSLLLWKGYLTLLVGSCGLFFNTLNEGDFRNICFYGGILGCIVTFFQELVGFTYTLSCSPEKCGDYLWNVNVFFFVWSFLWGPALLCCMVSCFTTIAIGAVAQQRREMELCLHPDKDAGSGFSTTPDGATTE